jgi:membrane protein EpsK
MGFSGWAAVNQAGFLLLMQMDIVLVNALFGAEMTGRYGSLLLFPSLIHMMVDSVSVVLSPAIMARYAVGDFDGLKGLVLRSVKLLGLGLALPVGLLCGFSRPLLVTWLGRDFANLDVLLVLLVGHLTVNLATRPLSYVLTAHNEIKVQGLITLVLGLLHVGLAIVLALWLNWGAAGVAAAVALVWTVRNGVFVSGFTAAVMHLSWRTICRPLLVGMVAAMGVAMVSLLASHFWQPESWFEMALIGGAISAAYGLIVYTAALSRSDRALLWSLAERSVRR